MLEEQINLNGIVLNIIDTAGIRQTDDLVERIGVDKAKKYLKDADLVIYVVDSSKELDENDFEIVKLLEGKQSLILRNKSDLTMLIAEEDLAGIVQPICKSYKILSISAKEQTGIEALARLSARCFLRGRLHGMMRFILRISVIKQLYRKRF